MKLVFTADPLGTYLTVTANETDCTILSAKLSSLGYTKGVSSVSGVGLISDNPPPLWVTGSPALRQSYRQLVNAQTLGIGSYEPCIDDYSENWLFGTRAEGMNTAFFRMAFEAGVAYKFHLSDRVLRPSAIAKVSRTIAEGLRVIAESVARAEVEIVIKKPQ